MKTGKPNTTRTGSSEMGLVDLNISANLYTGIKGTYLKVEAGMVQGSRKISNVSYNNLGTGTVRSTTEKIQSSYTGASLGFDSRDSRDRLGVFAEVGFRNATSVGIVGTVGLNIGF